MLVSLEGYVSSLETSLLVRGLVGCIYVYMHMDVYIRTYTYYTLLYYHKGFYSKSVTSKIWVSLKQSMVCHFDLLSPL